MLSYAVHLPANIPALALFAGLLLWPISMCAADTQTNSVPSSVRLPLEFQGGNAIVRARANVSKTELAFKLDTGFGITTIHPDLVETLQLRRAGSITIVGIAGREQAGSFAGANFDFGGMIYSPRRVAVIPSDADRRRRGRDGILGASFFRRFVVELDPASRTMTLHEPGQFRYAGEGEIIPLEFREDTPIVEAAIHFTNRPAVRARFEIDSGCDGALCLGHDFVEANGLDSATNSAARDARQGVGGTVNTRLGRLHQFQLGKVTLDNLPANFFIEGSPVDKDLAGHIGMGLLRRFKVIFDYSRKQMILEPVP
jgi:predicted aspartyl protease